MVFLGREISEQRDYSDKVAETIDDEVHALISTAYDRSNALLTENKEKLMNLAKYLMEHETADAPVLEEILGKPPTIEREPI